MQETTSHLNIKDREMVYFTDGTLCSGNQAVQRQRP